MYCKHAIGEEFTVGPAIKYKTRHCLNIEFLKTAGFAHTVKGPTVKDSDEKML